LVSKLESKFNKLSEDLDAKLRVAAVSESLDAKLYLVANSTDVKLNSAIS
jgi:hypothetical protein